ncbi:MAG: PKD domain-containing protein [Bacteroidia bacterium]
MILPLLSLFLPVGSSPYSFSLDSLNFQNSPIFQNLPSGSYIGFVKDSVGCVVQTEEIVINEPNPPVVSITPNGDTTICIGTSITLEGSAGFSSYLWSSGNQTSQSIQVNAAGPYLLQATDSSGCVSVDSINVNVIQPNPASVTIDPGADTTICAGTSLMLMASTGFASYDWIPGNLSGQSIQVNNTGAYMLQATDSSGCVVTDSIIITVIQPNPVMINPGGDTTICAGSSVTLSGNPGFAGYVWTPGNQTSQSIQVNSGGIYLLQATDSSGCEVFDSVMVNVQAPPTASFTYTPDSVYTFSDQSSGAVSWNWDFGDGSTSTQQNPGHAYTASGTYEVCLTVADQLGCSDTTCQSLSVTLTSLSFNLPFSLQVTPNPGSGIYMLRERFLNETRKYG